MSNYNSSNGYNWCNVNTDGSANNNNGNNANGLAPDSYGFLGVERSNSLRAKFSAYKMRRSI